MHHILMAVVTLQIDNMHCGACIRRVTQTLNALPFTHADAVQLGTAGVTTGVGANELLAALKDAGFPAHVTSTNP